MNNLIQAGGNAYRLYTFTGKVVGASKNMETKVSGSGGGGYSYKGTGGTAPVHITSTTVVLDQIFMQDAAGNEHALQLENFNVACREGNVMTAAWAIRQNQEQGPYIVMLNHTTRQAFYNEPAIKKMFSRHTKKLMYIAGGIGALLGVMGGFMGLLVFGGIGALIGWAIMVPDKAAIAAFKSSLRFEEFEQAWKQSSLEPLAKNSLSQ